MKIKKGEVGYIKSQKIRRFLITLILFIIPVIIFISGYIYHGTRENVLTIVAVVGCLPGCKSAVGLIMMMLQKTKPESYYTEFQQHAGFLCMAYDLVFTTYEKNVRIDAAVICGHSIVCLADGEIQEKASFIGEHLRKMLKNSGYPMTIHVLTRKDKFVERLDSLNKNKASLEDGFDPMWNTDVKAVMLNLAL